MNNKQKIDALWLEFRTVVGTSYATAYATNDQIGTALRDYVINLSMCDKMEDLLARETANERNHRRNRPSIPGFPSRTAAMIVLMNQARMGAEENSLPCPTGFLVYRREAMEAQVIGWLCKHFLTDSWKEEVKSLDYAKLMQPEQN